MRTGAFAIIAFLPLVAFGWGGQGHQLVALIAEDQLTPAARAMVKSLLDGASISDAEIVNWADQVRRARSETAPWHYVNIPVDALAFNRERDGHGDANVIDAIERQAKVLADRSQPRDKRVEALKFVIHFVGDIHQPLHCAERNGDKGGNRRLVFWQDQRRATNLHAVWDTNLVQALVVRKHIADVADEMARTITRGKLGEWHAGSPQSWADESHQIAVKIYEDVPLDGPPPKLDRGYLEKNSPIVAEQLKRGGVRLAMILNAAAK